METNRCGITKRDSECLKKVGEDEPIFVLRAQDRFAPIVVREWARLVENERGRGYPKAVEARLLADKMEAWRTRKVPD